LRVQANRRRLGLCDQHRYPQVGDIPWYPLKQPSDIDLTLSKFRDELDPANKNAGIRETLEAQNRTDPQFRFHASAVLFINVVRIGTGARFGFPVYAEAR